MGCVHNGKPFNLKTDDYPKPKPKEKLYYEKENEKVHTAESEITLQNKQLQLRRQAASCG